MASAQLGSSGSLMSSILGSEYFKVKKNGLSEANVMGAYLFGSAFQTVADNPITAYRQYVQQFAKDAAGKMVDPKVATAAANEVFRKNPLTACASGLVPRLVGVGFKRIPKFGILLGVTFVTGREEPGAFAATAASIGSAYMINPVRVIEKQQRAFLRETGRQKGVLEILRESSKKNFLPLQNGVTVLMMHSWASAITGLVGQPQIQKYIQKELNASGAFGTFTTNLISSAAVTPIYVTITNPLSRLEVIMQTTKLDQQKVGLVEAIKLVMTDTKEFGLRGIFRGQGIGMAKAIISLTLFHQGRLWAMDGAKWYNGAS